MERATLRSREVQDVTVLLRVPGSLPFPVHYFASFLSLMVQYSAYLSHLTPYRIPDLSHDLVYNGLGLILPHPVVDFASHCLFLVATVVTLAVVPAVTFKLSCGQGGAPKHLVVIWLSWWVPIMAYGWTPSVTLLDGLDSDPHETFFDTLIFATTPDGEVLIISLLTSYILRPVWTVAPSIAPRQRDGEKGSLRSDVWSEGRGSRTVTSVNSWAILVLGPNLVWFHQWLGVANHM
ncbi:hypothetical protein BDY19DRAFT_903125 [Irpex rosettiformis]|uniref:Uncharacterized protein n=1 Tax=Irpex rosettiformis TaxID=378272 RepID=A0ACB8UGJ0_9APHY|nr:hypothetical protein BDY19DRAFT_903125 [Irpex rosettiformis]